MGGGALDSSVTLDEVFAVVGARRVPLAPELAGYLVLEVAEHADPAGGDVDAKSIFVGEEGTVALVKPRRTTVAGDAETSIRAALARLLEASGSQTPALAAASRRKSGAGLPALAEELEAALIPVNRAAGRRALARLAREVKRVTLGVGRSALPAPGDAVPPSRRASSPSHAMVEPSVLPPVLSPQPPPVAASPVAPPVVLPPLTPPPPPAPGQAVVLPPITPPPPMPRTPPPPSPGPHAEAKFGREEEPTTARGQIPAEVLKKATPEPSEASELPTMQFEPQSRGPSPSQADVDSLIDAFGVSEEGEQRHARELKAIAGLDPTPPPPGAEELERLTGGAAGAVDVVEDDLDALLALGTDAPGKAASKSVPVPAVAPVPATARAAQAPARAPVAAARAPGAVAAPAMRARAPSLGDERQLPTQPSKVRVAQASMSSISMRGGAGRSLGTWLIGLAAIAGGIFGIWRLRPDLFAPPAPPSAPAAVSAAPQQPALPCLDMLVVNDVPAHAEVLVRKGQAPVDVERMPVGARLEFVATAEGFAPKRVVVPPGAAWDTGADGKPRFEAAVQLDKSKATRGVDPWPAGDPGSEVGGQGPPGTVHVVATPRGAEIWMLAGLGPDTRIEQQLACDEDVELLLAGPTTYRKRLHVPASSFVAEEPKPGAPPSKLGQKRSATISAGSADK